MQYTPCLNNLAPKDFGVSRVSENFSGGVFIWLGIPEIGQT